MSSIQAGLGVAISNVQASSVVLVTLILDDSSSIEDGGNTQALIDGTNLLFDAVGGSKENDGTLAYARLLNKGILYPYCALSDVVKLNTKNFRPSGLTPLYDVVAEVAATVAKKTDDFAKDGVPCRSIIIFVTDGANVGSRHHTEPESIKPLIEALLRTEQHIVCGMGITDGYTDFRDIFSRMGVRPKWILTPGNSQSEIRAAFSMASKSAARASQAATGGAFSTIAAGGFGAP